MLRAVAVLLSILTLPLLSPPAHAAPGALDATFGTGGKVITDLGTLGDQVHAVGIQADGKVVAAGRGAYPNSWQLARYNPDGSMDPTFGNAGVVVTPGSMNEDGIKAIVIRQDGRILVGGTKNVKFALGQYNPDGTIDTAFGTNGLVIQSNIGTGLSAVSGIVIRPDGKILAGGLAYNKPPGQPLGGFDFAVAQYLPNGALDTAFANGGILMLDVAGTGAEDEAYALALQPDGTTFKILLGGRSGANQTINEFAMVRLIADGSVDTSFGQNGAVITAYGGGLDIARGLLVQPDGRIILVGTTSAEAQIGGNNNIRLSQFLPDGAPDPSFGGGSGTVITDLGTSNDWARAAFLQCDQKIVVGGYTGDVNNSQVPAFDFALVRYNTDGSLDAGFDGDGIVTTSFAGTGEDFAFAVAMQPDGKLVAGGATGEPVYAGNFALARYEGVANSADLQITMTDAPDPVAVGGTLRYDIQVRHVGRENCAFNTAVTDTLPASMTLLSATSSQGSCSGTTTVNCQLGPIMVNQLATIQLQVRPQATGTFRNQADVTSTTPDPQPINNSVRVETTVQ